MESDPHNHQEIIASLKLDKDQTMKLQQMYNHVKNRMKVTNPRFQNPVTLNRFLITKSYNLDKATKLYEDYLKWRLENNINDTIKGDMAKMQHFKTLYPKSFFFTDKEGRPLIIEQIGRTKFGELFKNFNYDDLSKIVFFNYELLDRVVLPACTKLSGKPITQVTAILDMKGIGMTDLMSKNVYNMSTLASKMVQEYFPEIVFKSYVINTPMLFSGFYNLMKPLLNSRTQATLCMPGSKFKKELAEAIPLENLPEEYGGTNPNKPCQGVDYGDYVEYVQQAVRQQSWDVLEDPKAADQSPADSISTEAKQQFVTHAKLEMTVDRDAKAEAGVKHQMMAHKLEVEANAVDAKKTGEDEAEVAKDEAKKEEEASETKKEEVTEVKKEEAAEVKKEEAAEAKKEEAAEAKKEDAVETKPEGESEVKTA